MHLPFFLKRPLAATDLEPVGSNPDKTWTRRLVLDVQQKWGQLARLRVRRRVSTPPDVQTRVLRFYAPPNLSISMVGITV